MRSKLESVAKQTGREVPELENLLEVPDTMKFLWMYFIDLHNSRGSNGFGVNCISYTEIDAYFRLMDIKPAEWEIQVIKRLDNLAMKIQSEESEKQAKKQQNKSKKS